MQDRKVASLLESADEELAAARRLERDFPRQSAYQLSQTAEKAARAVCEQDGIQVGVTHNLGQIAARLPAGHPMQTTIEALNYLSSSSTRYRYPDVSGRMPAAPPPARLSAYISEVDRFIGEVRAFLARPRPN